MSNYALGQQVYFCPSHKRWDNPRYVTITKVGRKWVEFGKQSRFDITTGDVDGRGYCSPGRIFESKEVCDERVLAQNLWDRFRSKMSYRFEGASSVAIREAAKLIGISLEEP